MAGHEPGFAGQLLRSWTQYVSKMPEGIFDTMPVWSNLEKALRSDRREAKAYCGFDPRHGYYVHIAERNRRCAKDAVPVTE